jgi:phospholipase/lecithinase/hemolysin
MRPRYAAWNELLNTKLTTFAAETPKANIFLLSWNRLLGDILDEPAKFGFEENAKTEEGMGIWEDHLHLTEAVHEIIAKKVVEVLMA